jgi:hypothetical protein
MPTIQILCSRLIPVIIQRVAFHISLPRAEISADENENSCRLQFDQHAPSLKPNDRRKVKKMIAAFNGLVCDTMLVLSYQKVSCLRVTHVKA